MQCSTHANVQVTDELGRIFRPTPPKRTSNIPEDPSVARFDRFTLVDIAAVTTLPHADQWIC
jgi:hypothetical protein